MLLWVTVTYISEVSEVSLYEVVLTNLLKLTLSCVFDGKQKLLHIFFKDPLQQTMCFITNAQLEVSEVGCSLWMQKMYAEKQLKVIIYEDLAAFNGSIAFEGHQYIQQHKLLLLNLIIITKTLLGKLF